MDIDSRALAEKLLEQPPRFWTAWKTGIESQTEKEMRGWTAQDWREEARYDLIATEGFVRNTLHFVEWMMEENPYDEELPYLQGWLEAALRNIKAVQKLIESGNLK